MSRPLLVCMQERQPVLEKLMTSTLRTARDSWRISNQKVKVGDLVGALRAALPRGGLLPARSWRRRHQGVVILLWLHVVGFVGFALSDQQARSWHTASELVGIAALAALASW